MPPAHFAELADVFDGDDGLRGEGLDKGDLVGGEGGHFATVDRDARDSPSTAEQGYREECSDPDLFDTNDRDPFAGPIIVRVSQIVDVPGTSLAQAGLEPTFRVHRPDRADRQRIRLDIAPVCRQNRVFAVVADDVEIGH